MTGGQYSAFRLISGLLLAVALAQTPMPYQALGLVAVVLFVVGFFHRAAAVALALTLGAATPGSPSDGRLLALLVLALHAALPPKPYATLAMRGDTDPGSTWRFPDAVRVPLWLCLGLVAARLHWSLGLVPLLALMPAMRPLAWLCLLLLGGARMYSLGPDDVPGWWLAVLLTFEADFVRPTVSQGDVIFYDGSCGLCHRFIRFVLSEDRDAVFKFAPLQSETFTQRVTDEVRQTLPDSVIVVTGDGRVLMRSAAVAHVLRQLGGLWAVGGNLAPYLPAKLLDAVYDFIASNRARVFKKPTDACPLMPKALRARFLY